MQIKLSANEIVDAVVYYLLTQKNLKPVTDAGDKYRTLWRWSKRADDISVELDVEIFKGGESA